MEIDCIARLQSRTATAVCDPSSGALIIPADSQFREFAIVAGAGTNYDQANCSTEFDFYFIGDDPSSYIESVTLKAVAKTKNVPRVAQTSEYQS